MLQLEPRTLAFPDWLGAATSRNVASTPRGVVASTPRRLVARAKTPRPETPAGDCYVPASANMKSSDDDWSGCGDAPPLRIGDTLKVWCALRPHGRNRWTAYKAERVATAGVGKARKRSERAIERHVRKPKPGGPRGNGRLIQCQVRGAIVAMH